MAKARAWPTEHAGPISAPRPDIAQALLHSVTAAVALNPKPADWTSAKVQSESDGEIFWKISNGRGAMPPWKHLAENDRWALIRYIRSLGGK
jgi:mono/diheme cytochrome c family protein